MPRSRIAWVGPDGTGRAPLDGGDVVRVAGTVPGDVVDWTEAERRGRSVGGRLDAIVDPSPDRVVPPCPYDAACGGCDLSALAEPARHRALAAALGHALGWSAPIPVVPSPRRDGHRARVRLAVRDGRLGYHAPRSHELVAVERCRVARPEIGAALPALAAVVAAHPDDGLDAVELRTDGERVVHAVHTRAPLAAATREALAGLGDVALDGRRLAGDARLRVPVLDLRLQASPDVFFQVNLEAADRLVELVRDRVLAVAPERVLDLYAGIGTLGLPLARAGVPVVAVERDGPAIADLRASAAALGLARVEALALPAERFDPSRTAYDVAVLDPPRAGADQVLARVLRNRPRRVVYVSCHVQAAARDLQRHARGYRLVDVTAVDLFPETHHLEAVLVLDRA